MRAILYERNKHNCLVSVTWKGFRKTGSNCSSGYFVDFSIVCKRFLFWYIKCKISILLYQIERKTARICLENPLYLQKQNTLLGKIRGDEWRIKKNQRKRRNEIRLILFYKNTRILFYNMQNVLDRFSTIWMVYL